MTDIHNHDEKIKCWEDSCADICWLEITQAQNNTSLELSDIAHITGSTSSWLAAKRVNYYAHTSSLLILDPHRMTSLLHIHKPSFALNFSH
jgi:hypothetical protein